MGQNIFYCYVSDIAAVQHLIDEQDTVDMKVHLTTEREMTWEGMSENGEEGGG